MSNIKTYLFETDAIKVCEEEKPFWLTSGTISPYFVNTHFVYGSQKEATELLSFIDECLSDKLTLPKKVFEKTWKQYQENETYKNVIDEMINCIKENINVEEIDYISAGERRDWFFSNVIAHLLNKPQISIYKDLSTVVSDSNFEDTKVVTSLEGKKTLHIADLITVASSYIRAWLPAVRNLGAKMCWSCVVVDRMQGGAAKIEAEGVKSLALANVNEDLFETAFAMGVINEKQLSMLKDFINDPFESMKQFLIAHPTFVQDALNSDEKTKKRAQLLIDGNLYGLN